MARALVVVLAELPFEVIWLDTTPGHFPERPTPGVRRMAVASLAEAARLQPVGGFHAVMTTSHEIDVDVVQALLRQGGSIYIGMIGSELKRTRLTRRLIADGFDAGDVARINCPIGVEGLRSKIPSVIAVSIAARALLAAGEAGSFALKPD